MAKRALCRGRKKYETWADAERAALDTLWSHNVQREVHGCGLCRGFHTRPAAAE